MFLVAYFEQEMLVFQHSFLQSFLRHCQDTVMRHETWKLETEPRPRHGKPCLKTRHMSQDSTVGSE